MWLFPHWTLRRQRSRAELPVCRVIRAESFRDLAATVWIAAHCIWRVSPRCNLGSAVLSFLRGACTPIQRGRHCHVDFSVKDNSFAGPALRSPTLGSDAHL